MDDDVNCPCVNGVLFVFKEESNEASNWSLIYFLAAINVSGCIGASVGSGKSCDFRTKDDVPIEVGLVDGPKVTIGNTCSIKTVPDADVTLVDLLGTVVDNENDLAFNTKPPIEVLDKLFVTDNGTTVDVPCICDGVNAVIELVLFDDKFTFSSFLGMFKLCSILNCEEKVEIVFRRLEISTDLLIFSWI